MSRGPVTQRFPAAQFAADSEKLLKCPTVKLHVEIIKSLLEADAERAQSETLRCAVAASEACEVCHSAYGGESDPRDEVEWVCEGCWHDRKPVAAPSAWDVAFDSAHADREDR